MKKINFTESSDELLEKLNQNYEELRKTAKLQEKPNRMQKVFETALWKRIYHFYRE